MGGQITWKRNDSINNLSVSTNEYVSDIDNRMSNWWKIVKGKKLYMFRFSLVWEGGVQVGRGYDITVFW